MSLEKNLQLRSNNKCELCGSDDNLSVFNIQPQRNNDTGDSIYVCKTCKHQIETTVPMDVNHWRCLNDSMWSEHQPGQVMAWRLLNRIASEGWPKDLLEMLYLDEEALAWAKETGEEYSDEAKPVHKDCNGAVLENGDTVTLTKTLNVKGSSVAAKRGYAVRRISLVSDDPELIEGKVEGQHIVIRTEFVKKQ